MKLIADLHCHTLASRHAYSTLRENMEAAKRNELIALAVTDHGIGHPDGPPLSYFENLLSLPEQVEGIRLLRGVEANIMDFAGTLDMPAALLRRMDIVVASFHADCTVPGSVSDHTAAYRAIAENPDVDIIGHSGTAAFRYDYEQVVPLFGRHGKVVEINAHTFICRRDSIENCKKIAVLCKRHGVRIAVNSDAHSEFEVAACGRAIELLAGIDFPSELVVNADARALYDYLREVEKRNWRCCASPA